MLSDRSARRFHAAARAATWRVDVVVFRRALEASASKAFEGRTADEAAVEQYLSGLRLEELALACACAEGDDEAWQHFVLTYRPQLYRAADAIDPSGGARELADSLYADLFGVGERGQPRQSLFRYFHGRSSLGTWLRAVLSQRHIDRLRSNHRLAPLPDEASAHPLVAPEPATDPHRGRFLWLMRAALTAALALLGDKDRLRLGCYYARQMTLAQVGRLLGEHEATVSRQLSRTRNQLRDAVVRHLHVEAALDDAAIDACFRSVMDDAGPLDLRTLLASTPIQTHAGRKESRVDRSSEGQAS